MQPGRRPALARGFTLIEVMIVLIIVAIMATGINLGLDTVHGRDESRALERLRRVLEATAERAMNRGQPLAVELLADGYRFWAQAPDGNWRLLIDPPVFDERLLPAGMAWTALIQTGKSDTERRLLFGSRPPEYELKIATARGGASLSGRITGEVRLALPGAGT